MKSILRYTRKYLPFIILTPLILVVEVILEIEIPKVMAEIVDTGIPSGNINLVVSEGFKMILMAFGALLAGVVGCITAATGAMGFGSELRKAVFGKIQDFSFEIFDRFQQSSLLTRLTTDVDYIQMGLRMTMIMLIRAPFMMIAASVVAFRINRDLFVIFAVAVPLLLVTVTILAKIAMPKFKLMLEKYDGLNDDTKDYLTNVRVVKAFVREDYENKKFAAINKQLRDSSIDIESMMVLIGPIMQLIIYGCVIAVYYLGGMDIVAGKMEVGTLTAFISYIGQIISGILMAAMIFINFVRLKGSVDRLSEVLNSEITLKDGESDALVENGSIDFDQVSFQYATASKESLKNIDLHIKTGETIGIIGSTGCGKSSLVQLIPRLYDVTEGCVKVAGLDVREYKLDNLRKDVSMVLQQNTLFSGTIKDNLRWGNEDASDEEIIEACKKAQAHDFIMAFPKQYDTDLGQGGVNVSGGQKQRLCIARALLAKPKIIILDDSTSAVDTHTDSLIRKALKEELSGTTTIIIAQRVASVMEADRVVVMDNGRIADVDTPERLLQHNEIYQDIYNTQMKGVESYA